MQKLQLTYIVLSFLFISTITIGQNKFDGLWSGNISAQGIELVIDLEILESEKKALISIPLQGLEDQESTKLTIKGDTLEILFMMFRARYDAIYNAEKEAFVGEWNQGKSTPFTIKRTAEKTTFKRPQTPTPPYPYDISEFVIPNENGNVISGTITMPYGDGPFPVAIMVSGSGGQDRNSEILKHKPFLVISDYLTRNGIAILRYDDRGIGKSKGSFMKATSADFASDAEKVLEHAYQLDKVDKSKVGIIGHSEGGLIAPMIAARNSKVGFIISLAGPGMPISELMTIQNVAVSKSNGMSDEGLTIMQSRLPGIYGIVNQDKEPRMLFDTLIAAVHGFYDELTPEDQQLLAPNKASYYMALSQAFFSPWFRYFLGHDPSANWKEVSCPVLAVNGDKDIQVIAEPNISSIISQLTKAGNKNVETKIYKGLNHLFQPCEVCTVGEYASIETTFDESVLEDIKRFVLGL